MSLQDPDFVACANSARILMGWFHQVGNLNLDIGTFLCANPTMTFALILVGLPSSFSRRKLIICSAGSADVSPDDRYERSLRLLRRCSHPPRRP